MALFRFFLYLPDDLKSHLGAVGDILFNLPEIRREGRPAATLQAQGMSAPMSTKGTHGGKSSQMGQADSPA